MKALSGRFPHTQRGVTIIELLVALAVFALFILMIDAVFSGARTNARKTEVAADVQQNARIAIYRITRELRETNINQIVYTSTPGQSQLVLKSSRLPLSADNTVFCLYARTTAGLGYDPRCFYGGLPPPPYTGTPPAPCNTTTIPCGTYTPLWQQYVGYYVQSAPGSNGPFALYRVVGNLTSPDQALNTTMLNGGDVIAWRILSFDIAVSGGIVSVTIQGQGTEKVQGQALPVQQIALPSQSMTRN